MVPDYIKLGSTEAASHALPDSYKHPRLESDHEFRVADGTPVYHEEGEMDGNIPQPLRRALRKRGDEIRTFLKYNEFTNYVLMDDKILMFRGDEPDSEATSFLLVNQRAKIISDFEESLRGSPVSVGSASTKKDQVSEGGPAFGGGAPT